MTDLPTLLFVRDSKWHKCISRAPTATSLPMRFGCRRRKLQHSMRLVKLLILAATPLVPTTVLVVVRPTLLLLQRIGFKNTWTVRRCSSTWHWPTTTRVPRCCLLQQRRRLRTTAADDRLQLAAPLHTSWLLRTISAVVPTTTTRKQR